MKKIVFLILLIVFSTALSDDCRTQVLKLRAFAFTFKYYDKHYRSWTDWSDWKNCKILMTIDLYEFRIKIYSELEQEYDVIDYEEEGYDYNGNETISMKCIDKDGIRCNVRLVVRPNEDRELYVDYLDYMWAYSVYLLE